MCLYITSEKKIAQKDLYTLKMAEKLTKKTCRSYYQLIQQRLGIVLKSQLVPYSDVIEKGLHSFCLVPDYVNCCMSFETELFNTCILLAKIPKGSTYYLGKYNEIASNQLILIEPLVVSGISKIKLEEEIGHLRDVNAALAVASGIALSYYGEQDY